MKFSILTPDSTNDEVREYLVALRGSIFSHHLDDDPSEVLWGDVCPDRATLDVMRSNWLELIRRHERGQMGWGRMWAIYYP